MKNTADKTSKSIDSYMLFSNPKFSKAYLQINANERHKPNELVRMHKWAHLVMPKQILKKMLLG